MAAISAAILCDFAQVREGLLFVASGGITRLFRESVPAPLGVMAAVVTEIGHLEIDRVHEIVVSIKDVTTAEELGRVTGGFQAAGALEPGESLYVPFVFNIGIMPVKSYGPHDIQISIDGGVGTHLTAYVRPSPTD